MSRRLTKIICLLLLPPLALVLYAAWWAVAYRLPRSADKTIDMRSHSTSRACLCQPDAHPRKLVFCAGLANNPHGFPGHAYVIWPNDGAKNGSSSLSSEDGETLGFCPAEFWSIVPSVYQPVLGVVDGRAASGNNRNVEKLTVLVDEKTFTRTRELAKHWDARQFRTGSRDCCAFVDYIARDAGLTVPSSQYLYPHDHVLMLKALNESRATSDAQEAALSATP